MDFFMQKELNLLKGETEESKELNFASHILYANMLQNGLGEEIKEYLKNPPKIDKKAIRKYKRKKRREELLTHLKNIFSNKSGN